MKHFQSDDAEAVAFDHSDDIAGSAFGYGVGFDDGERTLQSFHNSPDLCDGCANGCQAGQPHG
jgi:hypothetical protein